MVGIIAVPNEMEIFERRKVKLRAKKLRSNGFLRRF